MNRLLGISGFLAVGFTIFWGCLIAWLPWIDVYSSRGPSMPFWAWLLWGSVCALIIGVVFAFFRRSLMGHWASLRHNVSLSHTAWRGVCGVYLLLMIVFFLPLLNGDPSGTHQTERYLYSVLVGYCLALGVLATWRGFFRSTNASSSTEA